MEQDRSSPGADLHATFGEIDIYLFDQLLRGRFDRRRARTRRRLRRRPQPRVTCSGGVTAASESIGIRRRSSARVRSPRRLHPHCPSRTSARARSIACHVGEASMDAVVCSAVLHFASDVAQFDRMLDDMWRVLAPAGMFFARLASNIGIESLVGAAGRRDAAARRIRSVRGGRGDAARADAETGRPAARSDQDDQRPAATLHDDLVRREDRRAVVARTFVNRRGARRFP